MENDQTQNPPPPAPEPGNLREQLDALQYLVTSVLLLLVILGATFCIFLWRQKQSATIDLDMMRAQWTNVMAQYQRAGPLFDDTEKKLQEFGRTNPDFVPILTKYGLKPSSGPAAPTSPTRLPGPAAPTGKK